MLSLLRVIRRRLAAVATVAIAPVMGGVLLAAALLVRAFGGTGGRPRLVWGPVPIINNKYWSEALREAGFQSETLMLDVYTRINRASDFDRYVRDLSPFRSPRLRGAWERWIGPYAAFLYAIRRFDVFHHPFSGGFLGYTPLWRLEAFLLRTAGKKTVIIPYGGEAYMYSTVADPSLRHALLLSYPAAGRREREIRARVDHWSRWADVVIPGVMLDGMGRWDVLPFSSLAIDTRGWEPRGTWSRHDGRSGPVTVLHTPNHRGFKGTEFLVRAVKELQDEGLRVELRLLEGVQNEEVRRIMAEEADILAEQFIVTGYGLSGVEGMASGLPVLANLESEFYTEVFRRYSYLDECPILSTRPETIRENLRALVTDPELRRTLGRAGREYVQKYHSYEAARYMFGSIYRSFAGEAVDLMNLFHPLKGDGRPAVAHPLVRNHLPQSAAEAGGVAAGGE